MEIKRWRSKVFWVGKAKRKKIKGLEIFLDGKIRKKKNLSFLNGD